MIAFALAILGITMITALGLGIALWLVHLRGKDGRQRLAQEGHDRSLALDQRCDAIEARLEALRRLHSVDHLEHLIGRGEQEGRWRASTSEALRDYLQELRAESSADSSPSLEP